MSQKIWKCEIHQDPKTTKTYIANIWRPVAGGLYLRIAPMAAPKDVREALLLTDEHECEPWYDGKPFVFDFRKLKRSAGKQSEFFKTFEYERRNRKYDKNLVAKATFEIIEPRAGFDHSRWHEDDGRASTDQLLRLGQELAKKELSSEFPRGLQDSFDKCSTQEEADLVINNVKPDRRTTERFNMLCQLAGVGYEGGEPTSGAYCTYCGNMHVDDYSRPCAACNAVLRGELSLAWEVYKTLQLEHRQCCGGLSSGKGNLYFHGKHWECSYPTSEMRKKKGWKGCSSVGVEMGVELHADHAATYWIFDNDSTTDSTVYGDPIKYYDPEFWEKLNAQLDQAAEEAWNSDILSCEHCGYHYHVGNGPCGCSASEEDDEDDNCDE
jgi:hypothetical protein